MTFNPSLRQWRTMLFSFFFALTPLLLAATTYTAIASGDWSSTLTWSTGIAPGANITGADQIIINANVTVTMDVDVVIDNPLAVMTLLGELSSNTHALTIVSGAIDGTGDLMVHKISLGATGLMVATGNVVVDIFETTSASLVVSTYLEIQHDLIISGGSFSLLNTAALFLDAGATITMAGGVFLATTGSLQSAGSINLIYTGPSQSSGAETSIGTIADLTVNLSAPDQQLALASNVTVSDTAHLEMGQLVLNGHNLTVTGLLSTTASAAITGDAMAGLFLDGADNISLIFSPNSSILDTLLLSQTNGTVTLNADLTVDSIVNLQEGMVDLNGYNLTVNGSLTTLIGASITGNASSNLLLNGMGDAVMIFSPNGAQLDTLVVSQSSGNVTLLASNLTVGGSVDLQQGVLVLNNGNLTVTGVLTTAAGASINGSINAGLTLDGTGDVSLVFAPNGGVLDTLVVSQSNGNVSLASNLTVLSSVELQEGALMLSGNDLTVRGTLSTAVGAALSGSVTSGLILDGAGDVSLVFSQNASLLDNFVVSQSNGDVTLHSDLTVGIIVNVQQGSLVLNSYDLTINGTLTTSAGASITGNAASGLFLEGTGSVSLAFSPNGPLLDTLVVSQNNGNVTLSSNLAVDAFFDLQQGAFVLNNSNLTINGAFNSLAGASITGSSNAGLILDGTGDVSLVFTQNSAILDTFVVHQTNGNVTLNADLTVVGSADLQQGALILNSNDLTITGTITTTAGASITGNANSSLVLDGMGNASLAFSPNSALLNTLVVSQNTGDVTLNSDLTVGSHVNLQQGALVLNGNDLTVNGSLSTAAGASITGTATSGLILNGMGNVSLIFSPTGAILDTLVVSQTNGNVTLNTNLKVVGNVYLQQGSLVLNGNNLTTNGTVTTSPGATITGSTTSGLILDGMGNLLLVFSPNGALLDTLVVSQSNGNAILNTNLTVGSHVNLQQGALVLNGHDLTVQGTFSNAVGASITGSISSGLILDGTGNVSLVFSPNTAFLNTLVVSQMNGNVTLNADLAVGGNVDLQAGSLVLNGRDLTINGSLNTSAGASITGSATSGLILDGTGNVSLIFSPTGALLNTFVVSQTNGNVTLNSDLTVANLTDLQQGSLVLNGHDLVVHGGISTLAGASITGSATSGLILDGTGNMSLAFSPTGAMLDTLVVSQTNGNVTLATDLTVGSLVDLQQGSLVLNSNDLTVNGSMATAVGASITGSLTSGLFLDGTGNVSLVFAPNSAQLGQFVVSQTAGDVSLQSDLTVGVIDLQQGSCVLNDRNLVVAGAIHTSAGASLTGSAASGVVLNGLGDVSLAFSANGALLDTFLIHQTNGNVTLNSELSVENILELQQGNLIIGDNNVRLSTNAHIAGGSLNSYVVTNGTGTLSILVEAGGPGVLFPCGSSDGYFPAQVLQGNGATDAQINVRVDNGVLAEGTTGVDLTLTEPLVNHTWFVGSDNANAQMDLDFKLFWKAAAEVNAFNRSQCYISHFTNGDWDEHAAAPAVGANGYFSMARMNITSLSPFRVADATSLGASDIVLGDVRLFPNPVSDETPVVLQLDVPKAVTAQLRIFNTAGQLVRDETIALSVGNNQYVMPTAHLQKGTYLIDIRAAGQHQGVVRRLVKI